MNLFKNNYTEQELIEHHREIALLTTMLKEAKEITVADILNIKGYAWVCKCKRNENGETEYDGTLCFIATKDYIKSIEEFKKVQKALDDNNMTLSQLLKSKVLQIGGEGELVIEVPGSGINDSISWK